MTVVLIKYNMYFCISDCGHYVSWGTIFCCVAGSIVAFVRGGGDMEKKSMEVMSLVLRLLEVM